MREAAERGEHGADAVERRPGLERRWPRRRARSPRRAGSARGRSATPTTTSPRGVDQLALTHSVVAVGRAERDVPGAARSTARASPPDRRRCRSRHRRPTDARRCAPSRPRTRPTDPCQSRWSGARFNHVATFGANRSRPSEPERRRLDHEHVDVGIERGDERHIGVPDRERLATRREQHVGDHRRDRRLAVGAGDRDHGAARGVPVGREVELAHAPAAPRRRASAITGWCSGTPGLGTSTSTVVERPRRAHRHAARRGTPLASRLVVGADDLVAACLERVSNGFARHAHAVHQGPHQSATPMWMKSA